MSRNPLFALLTRQARGPSLRLCLLLAGVLGLAGLAVSAFDLLDILSGGDVLSRRYLSVDVGLPVAAVVVFLGPPVAALVAAVQTSRERQRDSHQLVRLTHLTEAQFVQGYTGAALYRLRLFLALVAGLVPLMVGGMLNGVLSSYATQVLINATYRTVIAPGFTYELPFLDIVVRSSILGVIALGLLISILPAAALGVMAGLQSRRPASAGVVAASAGFGADLAAAFVLALLGPTIGAMAFATLSQVLRGLAVAVGLCALPPMLVGLGVLWLAREKPR